MTPIQKALLCGAALGVWSLSAFAEFGPPMVVENVRVYENGCTLIKVPSGNFNAGGYLTIDPNQAGRKDMLAIALAAQLSGKQVQIDRGVRAGQCWGSTDQVIEIQLN